jgi:hypothetical protein
MSSANKSNFGNNLTSILVALIGAISAIGGAWITVYGPNSAQPGQAAPAPAASVTQVPAAANPIDQPATSAASSSPQAVAQTMVAPVQDAAPTSAPVQDSTPANLPNSRQIPYNQPWPNDSKANQLIVQTVEVADNLVRVHLLFDNTTGSAVKFYTSLSGQGIHSYLSGKKDSKHPVTGTGGALFADPNMVEIPAGTQKQGWLEYKTDAGKLDSLNLYLESYTEGYPAGQSGTITYRPIRLKVGK